MSAIKTLPGSWLAVVAAALLGGEAAAQAPASAGPDPAKLFAAARPALEEAAGWRPDGARVCLVATAAELKRLPDPDVETQVRWQFPDLQGEERTRAVAVATDAVRCATVARWIDGQGLLLFPDNARQMARWDPSLARADSPQFLQLMLVYETVRAHVGKRHDLPRRLACCRDAEEYLALQALGEGRALFVTREVSRRLGTELYFSLVNERFLHLPDAGTDPLVRLVSQETLRQRRRSAVEGLAFFDYLQEQGVRQPEELAFARPPRQQEWVSRPELFWKARQEERGDLVDVLARLEQTSPGAAWRVEPQPWTPDMVRQAAALFGVRERAERVLDRWEEGRGLLWTAKGNAACQVGVGVIRFRDAAAAQAYYGLAADLHRKQDEMLGGGRVRESRARAVTLQGTDEAVCTEKRLQLTPGAEPSAINEVCARRGETVVQFTWTGLPTDTAWAERVLREVLREDPR